MKAYELERDGNAVTPIEIDVPADLKATRRWNCARN